MLSFPAAIKVYLCTVACDMRRSFDGLSMMAQRIIRCNPFSGHLLVFCNRRSDRLKILYWDRDGWAISYKRLEAGASGHGLHAIELEGAGPLWRGRRLGDRQQRRGVAVGRKNWMFFGSDSGGRTAAVLNSLIASCKRLHIDPFAYLRDIFARIAAQPKNRLEDLLPDKWEAARQKTTS